MEKEEGKKTYINLDPKMVSFLLNLRLARNVFGCIVLLGALLHRMDIWCASMGMYWLVSTLSLLILELKFLNPAKDMFTVDK